VHLHAKTSQENAGDDVRSGEETVAIANKRRVRGFGETSEGVESVSRL
jgi:hypothetical protein